MSGRSEDAFLYHAFVEGPEAVSRDPYAPESLAREGFIHCSYRDSVVESARAYLPKDRPIVILRIDPRKLGASELRIADTPRGPMPHVHGPIPKSAIVREIPLEEFHGGFG